MTTVYFITLNHTYKSVCSHISKSGISVIRVMSTKNLKLNVSSLCFQKVFYSFTSCYIRTEQLFKHCNGFIGILYQ